MKKYLILADLHLNRTEPERYEAFLEFVENRQNEFDSLIFNGDTIHSTYAPNGDSNLGYFEEITLKLRELGKEVYFNFGNHDYTRFGITTAEKEDLHGNWFRKIRGSVMLVLKYVWRLGRIFDVSVERNINIKNPSQNIWLLNTKFNFVFQKPSIFWFARTFWLLLNFHFSEIFTTTFMLKGVESENLEKFQIFLANSQKNSQTNSQTKSQKTSPKDVLVLTHAPIVGVKSSQMKQLCSKPFYYKYKRFEQSSFVENKNQLFLALTNSKQNLICVSSHVHKPEVSNFSISKTNKKVSQFSKADLKNSSKIKFILTEAFENLLKYGEFKYLVVEISDQNEVVSVLEPTYRKK